MEWSAVMLGDEGIRVHRLTAFDRHDHVHVAGPGALGVKPRRLSRMVWMAVVVADDVHGRRVGLALDADVVARIDLVAVACSLHDDVARPLDLGDGAVAPWPDHDAADLVRVTLGAMLANRIHRGLPDFHAEKTKWVGLP